MTSTPTVRAGQVWADNDKRSRGRRVNVDEHHALVQSSTGTRTRIRLDRFRPNSTGYRLLTDVTP